MSEVIANVRTQKEFFHFNWEALLIYIRFVLQTTTRSYLTNEINETPPNLIVERRFDFILGDVFQRR